MRALPFDARAVASLDRTLHEPARLCIVACLAMVEAADFVFLQSQTGMTGGNLSSHVSKLAGGGYIDVDKQFVDARPRTTLRLTAHGRETFAAYLQTMRSLLEALDEPDAAATR